MQFVGILNSDDDIPLKLSEEGFQRIIQNNGFCFFIKNETSGGHFSSSEYRNIFLAIAGAVTNGKEIIKGTVSATEESETAVCESIIQSYIDRGEQVLSELDGSYVVILWNGDKKILYIQRDCYGTKYLYYSLNNNKGLVFSHNLDILMKTRKNTDIRKKALHEYLRFLDISPPYTIYADVFSLEPEKTLTFHNGEVFLKDVPEQNMNANRRGNLSAEVKDFKRLMLQSIERRIQHSQRTGIFLSGGIDSALLCALASKINSNLRVYTVGFDDPRYDESNIARDITTYLGLEHTIFTFSPKEDYDAFFDLISNIPSPFADPAVIPTFQCFRSIADTLDVVLDGTGGDSLIGIMPARYVRFILHYSRHMPVHLRLPFSKLLKMNKTLCAYAPLFDFEEPEELLIRWKGWTKNEISLLCNEQCDLSHTRHYKLFEENIGKGVYALYSILIGATQDDRIHYPAMLFGLNVAFPYWDNDVHKFVKDLPLDYKYHEHTPKILFRKVLKESIPPGIWDMPKQGFNYPFEKLLRYKDCELAKTFLSEESVKEHGFFNTSIVHNYLRRFLHGDDTVNFKIWALVLFQAWYHRHYRA
jgi:asparagine synthase (glutamine-hydrolysing)